MHTTANELYDFMHLMLRLDGKFVHSLNGISSLWRDYWMSQNEYLNTNCVSIAIDAKGWTRWTP